MAKQSKTLDQIWPDLEAALGSVLTRLIDGLSVDSWMAHYTYVMYYMAIISLVIVSSVFTSAGLQRSLRL